MWKALCAHMKSLRNQLGVSVHIPAHYVATANLSVARLCTYSQICICIRICPDASRIMQDLCFQGRTRMSMSRVPVPAVLIFSSGVQEGATSSPSSSSSRRSVFKDKAVLEDRNSCTRPRKAQPIDFAQFNWQTRVPCSG
eukprot:jgi/Botrbrau1/2277/Bobra.101_2s0100.1